MDNPEPRAQYLNVVLRQIERTALRIPRFQRDFVWNQRDILELLESIEKGYPIGSVLTWRVAETDRYFSGFRESPFPTADKSVSNFEVVLDGAQRLSSLYGCLRNSGADLVYEVSYDLRTGVFVATRDVPSDVVQAIPMDALFDSRKFLAIQARLAELEESDRYLRDALDLYSTFQDYQIPIIALSHAELEDVVEVFRRVNSTGTPLSAVDFVRALTWRSSFDLQETFEEFAERYEGSPLDGLTEDFLIRCLAIVAGLSLDARDMVRLKDLAGREGALSTEVDQMRTALDSLAEFLARFDIRGVHEVPYEVQRLLLFGFMHFPTSVSDDDIEAWFWRSTFAEEHQSKPESYTTRLIREMRAGNAGAALTVRSDIDYDLLAARVRRGGTAVATGFELLMRRTQARSLLSGEPLAGVEAVHGALYQREELWANAAATPPRGQILANVVYLSPTDAPEWRGRQRAGARIQDLYDRCEAQTGAANSIWASQGLCPPFDDDPHRALRRRSQRLLEGIVPPQE